jgi:acetyltransferase-like isoleucine patch superfamily enzyme
MTFLSRCMNIFPALHCSYFISDVSVRYFFMLLFCIYGLPLLCMKLHQRIHVMREGTTDLLKAHYSAWWGAHQIQAVFNALPFFETILRLIPGAYSLWLRSWGSQIGKKVYWTSQVEITDRSLMNVGDHVIFGHKVACYSHVIARKPTKLLLYVKRIKIGDHVFIGAGSRLGPGTIIAAHTALPLLTDLKINQHTHEEVACQISE